MDNVTDDGRVLMQAPERSYADAVTTDGHVYRQDADRRVRAWPFHVSELIAQGLRPLARPEPEPVPETSAEPAAKAKR